MLKISFHFISFLRNNFDKGHAGLREKDASDSKKPFCVGPLLQCLLLKEFECDFFVIFSSFEDMITKLLNFASFNKTFKYICLK